MCWSAAGTAATSSSVWMYVWITVSRFEQKRLLNAHFSVRSYPLILGKCAPKQSFCTWHSRMLQTGHPVHRSAKSNIWQTNNKKKNKKKKKKKQAQHDICVFIVRTKEVEGSLLASPKTAPVYLQQRHRICLTLPQNAPVPLLLSTMSQWVCLSPLRLWCSGKSGAQSLRGHIFIIHYVSFFPSLRWPCWWCEWNRRIKSHL